MKVDVMDIDDDGDSDDQNYNEWMGIISNIVRKYRVDKYSKTSKVRSPL